VTNQSLGQYLELVAWNAASALKEGADAAIVGAGRTVDALDLLAILRRGSCRRAHSANIDASAVLSYYPH
jgi:hypothetical protein